MSSRPIGDYALLSDCRSAALVSTEGSVDWLCLPRFDSPAVFGRLLDEAAGHWTIRPCGTSRVTRRYVPESLVLETTFHTPSGTVMLLDALAMGHRERGHALGASSPGVLLRRITCTSGSVAVETSFAPRPEFGLVHPVLSAVRGGLSAYGGAQRLVLSTPLPLRIDGSTARGETVLKAGKRIEFALSSLPAWGDAEPDPWPGGRINRRLNDTVKGWRSWTRIHQGYQGPWRDEVAHSGRVLQGLSFTPTGAIVAAATTSLPESIGADRNWDYRYTWVRDASFTLQALSTSACEKEKATYFGFLAQAAATQLERGANLQVIYGIGGERDLSERTLPHLSGWRGSTPVRTGNDAWRQHQLDVYGELLDAAHQTHPRTEWFAPPTRSFLLQAAETAARRWREPDQGIWELRGPSRHFLYSKLMCWVALDRAIDLAPALGATPTQVTAWRHTRQHIRRAIEDEGWNPHLGAFTQAFGSSELDASALMLPLVGFLPGDDPRIRTTVAAIASKLTDARGHVRRYLRDDFASEEGAFLLCTFWLAHALALIDEVPRAREVFETALSCANEVGLLAEEISPTTGEALGNYPQAFSHIGLINAARAIGHAERARRNS
ncbi:glycoside hydrolase family 15 protein [Streptomyces anulatus]|uniref:glycoside hydrolase family 15 protein n=1 Tax=Streptomyces anulatus TaxID=1892 RepID=UPI00225071C0|nr:glycoside hydrolase family 15 protein [Streptomyces anulatus]MCX4521985.1 glycoside hydrolase family 15 protein [Streptomyces anulatus]MCX4604861.1 glycoside hydrolase family 15 protein [Streptomyces anulatus]WTE29685.1 glycoside hydrolase family 15 protein [Streptomyces anulatus]